MTEARVYLAKKPALRAMLHGIDAVRRGVRKVPWPKSWLKAARTRPHFLPWLR